jgi:competence protein ComEA
MLGVLGCVAFLGKQSEEESTYGARVPLPKPVAEHAAPETQQEHDEKGTAEHSFAQAAPVTSASPPCSEGKAVDAPSGILPDGRIIMNEATQSDFTRLPGVGEARAAKIIELRTRMGKFRQVADLLRVRGIGWKTLQSMKDMLVVDRPVESPEVPSEKVAAPPPTEAPARKPSSS